MNTPTLFRRGVALLSVGALAVALLLPAGVSTVIAASSWNPTLLVNTEAFQIIDSGDGSSNIELRFGQSGNRVLYFDVGTSKFIFTQPVLIQGNLTATGSLSVKRAISGATLRIDSNADIWGALSATGAIKTKSTLTINSDSDTTDATLTFGNTTADQTLKFVNTLQRFELSKPLWVNGNLSASGALFVQDNINTRADLKINGDSGAADATITFGNSTADQTVKFNNARQRFELSKDVGVRGTLSGSSLRVDGASVNINNVGYTFTGTQGNTNTFLKNDGAGGLTWSTSFVGNSSGNILSLIPLYPNAVYTQSGTTAVGQLTNSGATGTENLYRWTTSRATLQDYWMSVRVQVPKNFNHWESASGVQLRLRTATTGAADNYITFRMRDTAGADVALGNNASLKSTVASTWRTNTVTGITGTYTPLGYITLLIKVAATSAGVTDLGYINLNWTMSTP